MSCIVTSYHIISYHVISSKVSFYLHSSHFSSLLYPYSFISSSYLFSLFIFFSPFLFLFLFLSSRVIIPHCRGFSFFLPSVFSQKLSRSTLLSIHPSLSLWPWWIFYYTVFFTSLHDKTFCHSSNNVDLHSIYLIFTHHHMSP